MQAGCECRKAKKKNKVLVLGYRWRKRVRQVANRSRKEAYKKVKERNTGGWRKGTRTEKGIQEGEQSGEVRWHVDSYVVCLYWAEDSFRITRKEVEDNGSRNVDAS